MILLIECIILCIIFTLIILPPLYKNPLSQIVSYPTAIRKRVESLPEYQNVIKKIERKNIVKKIIASILIAIIFAAISYFSGAKTFLKTLVNTFIMFFVVNLYDLIVLDIIIFCHSKNLIIKGTEDMVKEYKKPKHHIIGFIKGICIGIIVSIISGGIVVLYNVIKLK
jgi:membrane-associated HD superfamily phosphohydrolase